MLEKPAACQHFYIRRTLVQLDRNFIPFSV